LFKDVHTLGPGTGGWTQDGEEYEWLVRPIVGGVYHALGDVSHVARTQLPTLIFHPLIRLAFKDVDDLFAVWVFVKFVRFAGRHDGPHQLQLIGINYARTTKPLAPAVRILLDLSILLRDKA
jgi:hypothetical protein